MGGGISAWFRNVCLDPGGQIGKRMKRGVVRAKGPARCGAMRESDEWTSGWAEVGGRG